jgi:hypothetical protein
LILSIPGNSNKFNSDFLALDSDFQIFQKIHFLRPPQLPLAIPADLAPRLMKLHGDPIAWWIGQFLKFVLKPQPETKELLDNGRKKLGFKKPIVGVHIRRTDKVGTEVIQTNLIRIFQRLT